MAKMGLFAYGSLTEGMVHYQRIQEFIRDRQEAWLTGTAYRLEVGFPVVVAQGSDRIPGQLLQVEGPALLWELLDRFHGVHPQDPSKSLFYRQDAQVMTAQGSESALVYFFNPTRLNSNAVVIENGDWLRQMREKPALTENLSERQKDYIRRLGATKGREIIPIDLPLYRELVNLEIIVDKGRRLALTKLGHEVCRYLG